MHVHAHVHAACLVCRELPGSESEVWFESSDGAYRWRQTASSVLLQLHALPDHITAAKQLSVSIEPHALRVHEKGNPSAQGEGGSRAAAAAGAGAAEANAEATPAAAALPEVAGQVCQPVGELLFEAELARAIVPEDSTWVFVRPEQQQQQQRRAAPAAAAAPGGGSSGGSNASAATVAALVPSANSGTSNSSNSGCHVLFELTKMNLELYER